MNRDVSVLLNDILESIIQIETYCHAIDGARFRQDKQIQDAVIRRFEIIGEAARHIPEDFRHEHSGVPWQDVVGMRDILIHGYFGIELERIWLTVQNDIKPLKKQITAILHVLKPAN